MSAAGGALKQKAAAFAQRLFIGCRDHRGIDTSSSA
jgi:hypothetical protein